MQRSKKNSREPDGVKRVFTCTAPECGRSFSRSEHLHRHEKNHTNGGATCLRCRAHFKRQDLLERHLSRHRQKDEEAGGEGIGTLNTRKRMWKDVDGHIVQRKPSDNPPNASLGASFGPQAEPPISPPTSSNMSDLANEALSRQPLLPEVNNVYPDYSFSAVYPATPAHSQNWISPLGPQPQSLAQSYLDVDYDQVFQPDTASSFNMPYTTQVNYDWLFNLPDGFLTSEHTDVTVPHMLPEANSSFNLFPLDRSAPGNTASGSRIQHSTEQSEQNLQNFSVNVPNSPRETRAQQRSETNALLRGSPSSFAQRQVPEHLPFEQSNASSITRVEFERPLATLIPTKMPRISGMTHSRMLDSIRAAKPTTPDGSLLALEHPLLSLPSIQTYCEVYFKRFNTAYPLIHPATFDPNKCETLLLLSLVLLGATYSEEDAHHLAMCIHDVSRPQIFAHASFSPEPELWMLQTILLVECFGKFRADQKQHDMSHLFHGMLINLIRRSDCQSVRPIRPGRGLHIEPDEGTLNVRWKEWVEAEEKKRLASLCFLFDVQHAVLFCQSLCMSAFELRLSLPCDQPLWEAPTAEEWSRLSRSTSCEPMYLLTLKLYLTQDSYRPQRLNALSRIIIFHGIMSIYWDMQRRDQTSLGVISSPSGRWQNRIEAAYNGWKSDFDSFCVELSASTEVEIGNGAVPGEARTEIQAWSTAWLTTFHAAYALLHSDFLDIQIYAGAMQILGRPVQRADFLRSKKVVKKWAASSSSEGPTSAGGAPNASIAAWHATSLLRAASQTLVDYDPMGLFHVPWCLYLATLITWAFHHAGPQGPSCANDDDSELVWDARAEMHLLLNTMVDAGIQGLPAIQGTRRTVGLVNVIADVLRKVRWGIVHEASTVLRGLIPSRLIRQSDVHAW